MAGSPGLGQSPAYLRWTEKAFLSLSLAAGNVPVHNGVCVPTLRATSGTALKRPCVHGGDGCGTRHQVPRAPSTRAPGSAPGPRGHRSSWAPASWAREELLCRTFRSGHCLDQTQRPAHELPCVWGPLCSPSCATPALSHPGGDSLWTTQVSDSSRPTLFALFEPHVGVASEGTRGPQRPSHPTPAARAPGTHRAHCGFCLKRREQRALPCSPILT